MELKKAQIALILKIGYLLNYYEKNIIINWADSLINDGDLDSSVIDLSLSSDKSINEVTEILQVITNELSDTSFIDEYFFGYFSEKLKLNKLAWQTIERDVLKYFELQDNFLFDDNTRLYFSSLQEDYSLRKDGFGGMMSMPDDLLTFLDKYKKYFIIDNSLKQMGIQSLELNNIK